MQFKHPEVLYFLALLIIPILVHLFQLQRYKKVLFTNVAFLQKINVENRKSSKIKKWLILLTRLCLLAAIILAFAQPYFGKNAIDVKQHSFIYLDNSLSTNTKGEKGNLLQIASQELIEAASKNNEYSLLTNDNYYTRISATELKNILLKTKNTAKKLTIREVLLKISTEKNHQKNSINQHTLISDFQNITPNTFTNLNTNLSLVQQLPEQKNNLAVDSVYVDQNNTNNYNINVIIKNQGTSKENIPIALYNNKELVSKQTFNIDEDKIKTISFSIQKTNVFLGKIDVNFEDTFNFDNRFYFSINANQKTNVLAIGNNNDFLGRIYTDNEFNFINSTIKNTNYNTLEQQQLIILNELKEIPNSLLVSLTSFLKKGGQLMIIPGADININSYNLLLKNCATGKINSFTKDTLKITKIHFNHPLFKNVFDKKVSNFQYPNINSFYTSSFTNASNLISFENNEAFIKQVNLSNGKLFWVAGSLNKVNSNFTNSPLIVPVFYNIGQQSLQLAKLYYTVNELNTIEFQSTLGKDDIVTITNSNSSFIPLQQNNQNKVRITTQEQPLLSDFYNILDKKNTIQSIAFNYPKEESLLQYLDVKILGKQNKNIQTSTSVADTFKNINKKNEVQWLWKWFLILAIVSLLLEIFILKYFKV